jgi:hypothetical protein
VAEGGFKSIGQPIAMDYDIERSYNIWNWVEIYGI